MNLQEFQAKAELFERGVSTLPGEVVETPGRVAGALRRLGRGPWAVKAQVLTGGRGKAGGVKVLASALQVRDFVRDWIGKKLVTAQTGPEGLTVRRFLIEKAVRPERELYASVVWDRSAFRPVLIVSPAGGMDIERVALERPQDIRHFPIDPVRGLEGYQARQAAFFLQAEVGRCLSALVKAFFSLDAMLLEINPLGLVKGKPVAMDAKLSIDDNALFRHPDLARLPSTEDMPRAEARARKTGVSYVPLDGRIGCVVNGAGLAMATMDVLSLHGGRPANFLDVGGGATQDQVTEAFRIVMTDKKVRVVFVNIFGGIMRCDIIAQGLLAAARTLKLRLPLVVRLEGNRAEEGRQLLAASGLSIVSERDLTQAARRAVQLCEAPL